MSCIARPARGQYTGHKWRGYSRFTAKLWDNITFQTWDDLHTRDIQNSTSHNVINSTNTCVTSFTPTFTMTSTLISFVVPGTVIIFCNIEIIFIGKKLFKREKQRILHYPSPGKQSRLSHQCFYTCFTHSVPTKKWPEPRSRQFKLGSIGF